MEDLTKQQMVLLTLLVSFVTSIATGIVTVSLVSQAPQATQTINRVIQQTVEQVVPGTSTTTQIVNTVVQDNDSAATAAVAVAQRSLVELSDENGFVGLALVATKGGELITDAPLAGTKYKATFSDGGSISYAVSSSTGPFSALVLIATSSRAFNPVTFASNADFLLGRSLIGLTGQSGNTVRLGAIGSIDVNASSTVIDIVPTFNLPGSIAGSPLVLLNGKVAGMLYTESDGSESYLPAGQISTALSAIK